ncbi:hypothetical protein [Granulicella mallensis]|uniref:Uncharacterized protein n=1 Tax=Granulicella mallensis TaxID=940614 RepID=A0A7W8EC03_9BACT|nr:hypothetical protein [Granulicella mallensis]MBB5066392.1 hypothetical protein [Granulicella mallensis]
MAEADIRRTASLVKKVFDSWPLPKEWTAESFLSYRANLSAWRRALLIYRQPILEAHFYRTMAFTMFASFAFIVMGIVFLSAHPTHRMRVQTYPWESLTVSAVYLMLSLAFRTSAVRRETAILVKKSNQELMFERSPAPKSNLEKELQRRRLKDLYQRERSQPPATEHIEIAPNELNP